MGVARAINLSKRIGIVGSSIAGLHTATLLARAGRDVTLYERTSSLEPTSRTLIVTKRVEDILGSTFSRSVVNHIDRFELYSNGHVSTISLKEPDFIIERSTLIQELAEEAQNAGASLRFGTRFCGLSVTDRGLTGRFKTGNETHENLVDALIGADGARSRVAREAGWPEPPMVSLVQATVKLPAGQPSTTTRVWFRPQDTPYFYWLIPESAEHGVLGVIGSDGPTTRSRLDAFIREHGLAPLGYQAALIPEYSKWIPSSRRLNKSTVYLVGDAAGQVKVSTVGGVATGLRGAAGVADEIISGSRRELRALKVELTLHLWIRKAMHGFTEDQYAALLRSMTGTAAEPLGVHNRDHAAKILIALLRTRPKMILQGVRMLLSNT